MEIDKDKVVRGKRRKTVKTPPIIREKDYQRLEELKLLHKELIDAGWAKKK
jgi:hypothetical protein